MSDRLELVVEESQVSLRTRHECRYDSVLSAVRQFANNKALRLEYRGVNSVINKIL